MTSQTNAEPQQKSSRRFLLVLLAAALVIAGVVSFYASSHPDGLEFVAKTTGFLATAKDSAAASSPLAGYGVAGIDDARLSGGVAGIIGVLLTLALAGGLAWLLARRSRAQSKA
jgi:hypothetical protein